MKKCAGIYQIDGPNNGIYVGRSVNIVLRKYQHTQALRDGNHTSTKMQQDWDEYGAPAFRFSTLEVEDTHDLVVREQYYLDTIFANHDNTRIYNTYKRAGGARSGSDSKIITERDISGYKVLRASFMSWALHNNIFTAPKYTESRLRHLTTQQGMEYLTNRPIVMEDGSIFTILSHLYYIGYSARTICRMLVSDYGVNTSWYGVVEDEIPDSHLDADLQYTRDTYADWYHDQEEAIERVYATY